MKKIHLFFGILSAVILMAAAVHTAVMYVSLVNAQPFTGLPPEAAFFIVGVPYAIGLAVLWLVWLAVWLIRRRSCKKNTDMI